jgi:hypothetical protein
MGECNGLGECETTGCADGYCLVLGHCVAADVDQCTWDGVCYDAGRSRPDNSCMVCAYHGPHPSWEPADDGASCDDGLFCTGADTCQSGTCSHAGNPCPAGKDCVESSDTCEGATNIELISFTATGEPGAVRLDWETATETDNVGFHLWRSKTETGTYSRITTALIPSEGSPTGGSTYGFTDDGLTAGKTYWYKLEDVDIHGSSTFHGPVSATPLRQPLFGCGVTGDADGSLAGLLVLVGLGIARRATRRR